jgi:hypothetical protein
MVIKEKPLSARARAQCYWKIRVKNKFAGIPFSLKTNDLFNYCRLIHHKKGAFTMSSYKISVKNSNLFILERLHFSMDTFLKRLVFCITQDEKFNFFTIHIYYKMSKQFYL